MTPSMPISSTIQLIFVRTTYTQLQRYLPSVPQVRSASVSVLVHVCIFKYVFVGVCMCISVSVCVRIVSVVYVCVYEIYLRQRTRMPQFNTRRLEFVCVCVFNMYIKVVCVSVCVC